MIDAGFTCPNRDGKVGFGGCTFCKTESFCPTYCQGSITEQLQKGKEFFAKKYPKMKYLAYFQPFSNTYATTEILRQRYEEALRDPDVVGLVIATRPDCLTAENISLLQELNTRSRISIEIGVESFIDRTLNRINRGHSAQTSIDAIHKLHKAGLAVGIHLIVGLPGETIEDILSQTEIINQLPVSSIKFHQLQILKGTPMEQDWMHHPDDFIHFSAESYANCIAQLLQRINPSIVIDRVASSAPSSLLVFPKWGKKPQEIRQMVDSIIQGKDNKTT